MPSLLEKINASADAKLPLPPGRLPSQELARYKQFLKVEAHRLKLLHGSGAGGLEICRARATMMDALLRHILAAIEHATPPDPKDPPAPRFALVAIGGYGRGELNPFSDIDILFLHNADTVSLARGKVHPRLRALTDGLLYTLWDLGLKVGHSVRTIEDCVKESGANMQSKTALIEARLVCGDGELFERMQSVVLARCVRGNEAAYIAARIEDQAARRTKHGNSSTMQEPNIKNGCGGLRDFQNLIWMAFFKYRTRSLKELCERGLITALELKQLEVAYGFLLRVRNDLHHHAGRSVDVLSKSVQPAIAHNLGFTDRSPVRRLEAFMREVYTHMRNIHLITRTLEQRLALLPQPEQRLPSLGQLIRHGRHRFRRQVLDGFQFEGGEVAATSARVFRDQPRRLMRVFLYAQQRGLRLHPDLVQLLRAQLPLVDRSFMRDEHVRDTFLEILGQRGAVAPTLRAMHEAGLLGKYIPEFGRLTCLVQHEFYHQYTADEHTLVCLEQADRVWAAAGPPHQHYKEIFQAVERPFLLHLALLLHDAGKALPTGDHSEAGRELALQVARRLGLDSATTHTLQLLIENHLAMPVISQRRDLDDPAVIRSFAALVGTPEHLRLLTIHSLCDSLGTSDKLWNGFKDSLLRQLHHRTLELLSGGTTFLQAEARQRELLAAEVRSAVPDTVDEEEVRAHFTGLPARYFQTHSAAEIVADLELVHQFMRRQLAEEERALEPLVTWHNDPDRGFTAVQVCTWDRRGLFTKITGALTAAGLNILSAQIFTRQDEVVLDTFFVTDAQSGHLIGREEREKFERLLAQAMADEVDLAAALARLKPPQPFYQALGGERLATQIAIHNEVSDTWSVIDVETEDHVGLLHAISHCFTELGLDLSVAKIATEKGAACDSFYVGEIGGGKLVDAARREEVVASLRNAIDRLAAPA